MISGPFRSFFSCSGEAARPHPIHLVFAQPFVKMAIIFTVSAPQAIHFRNFIHLSYITAIQTYPCLLRLW